jgi:hypothetical protein
MSLNYRAFELLVQLPLVAMLLQVLIVLQATFQRSSSVRPNHRPRTTFLALLKANEMLCAKCSPRVMVLACSLFVLTPMDEK